MKKKKTQEPLFTVRAYCSDCGKLLMESPAMTKRQLMVNWDQAVLDAPGIICEDCDPHRCPNFHLELKIYHKALDKEFKPDQILPAPENTPDIDIPEYLLKGIQDYNETL